MKRVVLSILLLIWIDFGSASARSLAYDQSIFDTGRLKPTDSRLKVRAGDLAPDFILKSVSGKSIQLSGFRGRKNVMLTFIPAAWTPVCSDQWPGYNIARELFDQHDTIIIGLSVDNLPTLHAWTRQMGTLWFDVVSDFWPHGGVSDAYGVLRSDGTAERALFIIDKQGIIRFTHVSDINIRPELGMIIRALDRLQ